MDDLEKYITQDEKTGEWLVHAKATGKVLGRHKTKQDALRQLAAIEANKHKLEQKLTNVE
jgi:hypothetical protein